jgi:hypothetical protein
MNKERRKGNPSTPTTLSLYTIPLPPSNHSPCSDVPSKSHPMILHTINTFLIITTTPHHPTSQHLRPLPYHTKLYRHHLAASSASPHVSAFLLHNSFHTTWETPSLIPKYHHNFSVPWQYPPLRLVVVREHFPTVQASGGIVDGIPPLLVARGQTSLVPK